MNILENKVTLVPKGNPKAADSFDVIAVKLKKGVILLAMGNRRRIFLLPRHLFLSNDHYSSSCNEALIFISV